MRPVAGKIDRRRFLEYGLAGGALVAGLPFSMGAASEARAGALDARLSRSLESSPLAYISPIQSDGSESQCHAEVWYAWLRGSVVVTVAAAGWKAQSISQGLDRARLWVGDYGRWKGVLGNNEKFRAGPSFLARAEVAKDAGLIEQLLAVYDKKYPAEIANWSDRMRSGARDGSRVLIRYTPLGPLGGPQEGKARSSSG